MLLNQGRKMDISETDQSYGNVFVALNGRTQNVEARIKHFRYVQHDVPALRAEGFITTMNDYYARLRFQLRQILWPNDPAPVKYLNTWPEVAKELIDFERFGQQYQKERHYQDILAELPESIKNAVASEEVIEQAYAFLSSYIEWDGRYSYTAPEDIDECFARRKGASGELNLMLLAVLRAKGVEAYPVLTSTRSHGKMMPLYPIMDQFNHVMVLARYGEQLIFLDLGSPHRPLGYPRTDALNGQGWLVDVRKAQWIDIPSLDYTSTVKASMNLSPEGALSGELQASYAGYAGMELRSRLAGESSGQASGNALGGSLSDRFPDLEVDSAAITALEEPNQPLEVTLQCRLPGAAVAAGDFLYFSPVIIPAFDENPFKQAERQYPVDIPHLLNEKLILQVELPEGFLVEESPKPFRAALPNGGGAFSYNVHAFQDKITVITEVKINQLKYEPEDYSGLKNFFDLILEKQGAQIVLRKKT